MKHFLHLVLAFVAIFHVMGGKASAGVLFSDDFSANHGWTLTNTWQIGAAVASSGQNYGNPDPAQDHTATNDNGILGAKIGGNVGAPDGGLHDFWYATSPIINASSATSVKLEFYRWLNSDYPPYITSRIEGFNGTSWTTIWTTTNSQNTPTDNSWVFQTFNVSAIADNNAKFQVRFGYNVGSLGVFNVSGWNVDDLTVSGISTVPEPTSMTVFGIGACVVGLGTVLRRRSQSRTKQRKC